MKSAAIMRLEKGFADDITALFAEFGNDPPRAVRLAQQVLDWLTATANAERDKVGLPHVSDADGVDYELTTESELGRQCRYAALHAADIIAVHAAEGRISQHAVMHLCAWLQRMHPDRAAGQTRRQKLTEWGKASGEARDPAATHRELARLILNALKRGENPRQYAAEWTEGYGIARSTLYRLIQTVEGKPKK